MRNRVSATALLTLLTFLSTISFSSPAIAATKTIVLADNPHRDLLGNWLDTDLATSLLPDGALGQLVFSPVAQPRTWVIDAALIEDVSVMAGKDPIAQTWLTELKIISVDDSVNALPYGHPDLTMVKKLAPTELDFYYETSQQRLQLTLGREVGINKNFRWTIKRTKVAADAVLSYTQNRRAIALLTTVVPPEQLDVLRSKLSYLLASGLTSERQLFFAQSADAAVALEDHKLRIVPGKYRLTSQHEKVPITLVNDFAAPVVVWIQLTPLNSRIHVAEIKKVSLAANSKTQISVPFTVIAPGSSAVLAQFKNYRNKSVGDSVILTLNLSVISPTVAWFTTGAAILLLLAALAQIIRRVRRSRK